jgi:hypothetical protein
MNALQKGLVFAAIQVALVSSLGAKLLWDRATEPRGWALTRGYDPDLMIRGRYVSVSLVVKADRVYGTPEIPRTPFTPLRDGSYNVFLTVENGFVVANPADHFTGFSVRSPETRDGETLALLSPPVVYFLPEHADNPLLPRPAATGATTVIEVTIPKSGPPRPIRFGLKMGDKITPLSD